MLSYKESDVRVRNILQSLTYNMAEKQLDRYDMKKLRHCHPMYTRMPRSRHSLIHCAQPATQVCLPCKDHTQLAAAKAPI